MNVGLTYDLKDDYLAEGFDAAAAAEFDNPETIEGIETAIRRSGHRTDRIGRLNRLVARLAAGECWDLVFNIAEGFRGSAREAQVPALLEAYGIPAVFGDALCLALCLHKGHAKRIVRDGGFPTPRFMVIADSDADLSGHALHYPLFVKPVAEGTGKGVSASGLAAGPGELARACRSLIERFRQPALAEEYLPGREFTAGVVGTGSKARLIGVMEVLLLDNAEPGAYTFENKDKYEDRVRYRLADDSEARTAGDLALGIYRLLGCRDAGRVDLRSDAKGCPQFMEINPLAGLNPEHSDLPILCRLAGMNFEQLIAQILVSAQERVESRDDVRFRT
ncbi:MAG: D-alanine--D-alanine ligase [Planctomycetota bacterium]|jgi:D-alanine-D-alanine ligase|nr:D-alanine--D-alanine ligase [Planctomycetota bacterium]